MSTVSEALRQAKEPDFLVELDFDGLVKRYAMKDITVPNSSGDDKLFEAAIQMPELDIGTPFDFRAWRYNIQRVIIRIANKGRLQDEETRRRLDGGIGRIYVWTPGLTWDDISTNGLIFCGAFEKHSHDKYSYEFSLTDRTEQVFKKIPDKFISQDVWSNVRTEGGAGSVAGHAYPVIFGNWSRGIPLKCVDTSAYKYLAVLGKCKSADADFTGGTKNVYDKNGTVRPPANYTFYPGGVDPEGNVIGYFDFTGDESANEPLSCSIEGLFDGSGEITGTAGQLIQHPADIVYYLMKHYSSLLQGEIHVETLKTMRSLLPGLKFPCIINKEADGGDIIDRILHQCRCARIQRGSGIGVVTFDTGSAPLKTIKKSLHLVGRTATIEPTPMDAVFNDIKASYALNPSTGAYEAELSRDRTNSPTCRQSYLQYGDRPMRTLSLPDVQDQAVATYLVDRVIDLSSFRHDIAAVEVPYWDGIDLREGDAAYVTLEEGASSDGNGWVDEPCILVERRFRRRTIIQKWWKIAT